MNNKERQKLFYIYCGRALQGLLSDTEDVQPKDWPKGAKDCPQATAMFAIQYAEALLKEIEKK